MSSPDFGAQAFLWWRPEIATERSDLDEERRLQLGQADLCLGDDRRRRTQGQYDWTIADRVVRHANDRGLKLLARLSIDPDKTNFWAGPPPQNADAFAEYAGALASRYNCQPGAWAASRPSRVWNEPNLAREWGGQRPNPAEYADFLRKAYAAIKAGNPNAIVINAGMAPTGDDSDNAMPDDKFYDLMYQAMGGNSTGYFDALGVHGAGYAAPPELDPADAAANQKYGGYRFFAFRHVEDIRAIMEKYGDAAKKIVLLEFGWTSDDINPAYKWHGADAGIDETVQGRLSQARLSVCPGQLAVGRLDEPDHHAQSRLAQRRQSHGRRAVLVGHHGAQQHTQHQVARRLHGPLHLPERPARPGMPIRAEVS